MPILTIKGIEQKSGTNKQGSAYTNWIATFSNGLKASTFDASIATPLVAGQTRDFDIEQKGNFKNLIGYGDVLDASAAAPISPGGASVPDEVWEAKDRRMAMESAAKSAAILWQGQGVSRDVYRSTYLQIYQDIIAAGEGTVKATTPAPQNSTTASEKPVAVPPAENLTDDTQNAKGAPTTPDRWQAAFEGSTTINELQMRWNEMLKELQPTGPQRTALTALFNKHKDRIETVVLQF